MDYPWSFAIFFAWLVLIVDINCAENQEQQMEYIPESEAIQSNHKQFPLGILTCDANVAIQ